MVDFHFMHMSASFVQNLLGTAGRHNRNEREVDQHKEVVSRDKLPQFARVPRVASDVLEDDDELGDYGVVDYEGYHRGHIRHDEVVIGDYRITFIFDVLVNRRQYFD